MFEKKEEMGEEMKKEMPKKDRPTAIEDDSTDVPAQADESAGNTAEIDKSIDAFKTAVDGGAPMKQALVVLINELMALASGRSKDSGSRMTAGAPTAIESEPPIGG